MSALPALPGDHRNMEIMESETKSNYQLSLSLIPSNCMVGTNDYQQSIQGLVKYDWNKSLLAEHTVCNGSMKSTLLLHSQDLEIVENI